MNDLLQQAYDPEGFRRQGHALIDVLADYLRAMQQPAGQPAIAYRPPAETLAEWASRLKEGEPDPMRIFQSVLGQSVSLHHPHYMGHQISPPAPMAALAGLVGDLLNNGMGVYEMGMAGSAAEEALIQEVGAVLGLGDRCGGFLTSGGTLANLTALLTARSVKAPTEVWTAGNSEPLALMVSEEAHYCVDRAARIMGWGSAGLIKIPSDDAFRMRTELLEPAYREAAERGVRVIAVVGSACSTAAGAFDDLDAIADFCARHNLWFHVDGAHGAALAFSTRERPVLKGIERADSVAMDFHKMLLTPSVTTALVYRDHRDSYRTFQQRADYLLEWDAKDEWHNLARRTFECTKLMLSLKAYTLWAAYGPGLFENYVDQVCDLGRAFGRLLAEAPDFELLTPPACNIVCYRLSGPGLSPEETDALNLKVRRRLLEQGDFYVLSTTIRGRVWLRSTLSNPFTEEAHLRALMDRCRELAKVQ
jgi:L-2,4-diaminobutyrate decarboxylase